MEYNEMKNNLMACTKDVLVEMLLEQWQGLFDLGKSLESNAYASR